MHRPPLVQVEQIVGGSPHNDGAGPTENFVSERPAGALRRRFRDDGLTGRGLPRDAAWLACTQRTRSDDTLFGTRPRKSAAPQDGGLKQTNGPWKLLCRRLFLSFGRCAGSLVLALFEALAEAFDARDHRAVRGEGLGCVHGLEGFVEFLLLCKDHRTGHHHL